MNDIAIARYIPPVSVPDMQRMAEAAVASRLFGITSVSQALTLMWLAQAEGRHPVLAIRDYDIIQGKPAKKAEAMLRDFISAGGTVEWHQLDDSVADATFSHPRGGEVRISWDTERAKQAGLLGKAGDMWRKFPRQMLRSRCVSEGIRTVGPMATSGLYVPEEVVDPEPRRPRAMKDVTPPPDAHQAPAAEPFDPETGEIMDTMADRARRMAGKGTEVLRNWLQDLSRDDRASLRELIGTADQPGALLTLARQADAEALQERLRTPPAPEPEHAASEAPAAPESPADASPAAPASPRPAGDATAGDLLPRDPATHRWILPKRPVARDWELFEDWVSGKLEDGISGRALRVDNEHALWQLRDADPARYYAIQERLAEAELCFTLAAAREGA